MKMKIRPLWGLQNVNVWSPGEALAPNVSPREFFRRGRGDASIAILSPGDNPQRSNSRNLALASEL